MTDALAETAKCDPDLEEAVAATELAAEAVAVAFARAVSSVNAFCETTQGGSVCAWAESSIEAFASAHATAVAEAFAAADNGCGCVVEEVSALAVAIDSVFVSAMSEVILEESCASGAAPLLSVTVSRPGRTHTS